jgi:dipeptidyl-peptidase-4
MRTAMEAAMTANTRLTLRDVAHLPLPGTNAPVNVQFSPDGRYVTYLYSSDNSLTRELWAFDRETGDEFRVIEPAGGGDSDETVSREEALRRERQRQLASGVTAYAWSREGQTLLVPMRGDVFILDGVRGEPRQVTQGGGCIDPQLTRDGAKVAFVKDGELYALDLRADGAGPVQLTLDASPAAENGDRPVTNGLAEFVAQEEMGRSSGSWWSWDGAWLAFEQVNATPVPLFLITHPGGAPGDVEAHRYPFAGEANVRWRLGVVPAAGGEVRWLSATDDPDAYLARVHWTPDGLILAQVESRDQKRLDVRRIDPRTAAATTLWTDVVEPWVNLTDDLRFLRSKDAAPDDYRILWTSEREGPRRVYLYGRNGALLRTLDTCDLFIDGVDGVDADGGFVYVEGWRDSPLEKQLFRVTLEGGAVEQVTGEEGWHGAALAPDFTAYADSFSSATAPPRVTLRGIDGATIAQLQAHAPADPRVAALALHPPEFVTVRSRDGETLYGAVYRPPDLAPGTRAPVVVTVYGGPHVQSVQNNWGATVRIRAQYLASEGFIVFALDNRGSSRRGLAFEGRIAEHMGELEVEDQVDGVRWLATLTEADTERVGVYGWSYGGYMTLMCLARAPDVFKTGVSGAPVTDWDGYDTHYTERYMATPESNAEGYYESAVLTHAGSIRGDLLLVHGMIDENVHFRHTARLLTELIGRNVPYELMVFPEERHSPRREEDRIYMERRIVEFFNENL